MRAVYLSQAIRENFQNHQPCVSGMAMRGQRSRAGSGDRGRSSDGERRPSKQRAPRTRRPMLYGDPEKRAREAVRNIADSGEFSSNRTIAEYAADILNVNIARSRDTVAAPPSQPPRKPCQKCRPKKIPGPS